MSAENRHYKRYLKLTYQSWRGDYCDHVAMYYWHRMSLIAAAYGDREMSETEKNKAPYSLTTSTPPALLYFGQPVFRLAWPGIEAVSAYEAYNVIAPLMVALLNKAYREGISTATVRSLEQIDAKMNAP